MIKEDEKTITISALFLQTGSFFDTSTMYWKAIFTKKQSGSKGEYSGEISGESLQKGSKFLNYFTGISDLKTIPSGNGILTIENLLKKTELDFNSLWVMGKWDSLNPSMKISQIQPWIGTGALTLIVVLMQIISMVGPFLRHKSKAILMINIRGIIYISVMLGVYLYSLFKTPTTFDSFQSETSSRYTIIFFCSFPILNIFGSPILASKKLYQNKNNHNQQLKTLVSVIFGVFLLIIALICMKLNANFISIGLVLIPLYLWWEMMMITFSREGFTYAMIFLISTQMLDILTYHTKFNVGGIPIKETWFDSVVFYGMIGMDISAFLMMLIFNPAVDEKRRTVIAETDRRKTVNLEKAFLAGGVISEMKKEEISVIDIE